MATGDAACSVAASTRVARCGTRLAWQVLDGEIHRDGLLLLAEKGLANQLWQQ